MIKTLEEKLEKHAFVTLITTSIGIDKNLETIKTFLENHPMYTPIIKSISEIREKGFDNCRVAILSDWDLAEAINLKKEFPKISFILLVEGDLVVSIMVELDKNHIDYLFFHKPINQHVHSLFNIIEKVTHA